MPDSTLRDTLRRYGVQKDVIDYLWRDQITVDKFRKLKDAAIEAMPFSQNSKEQVKRLRKRANERNRWEYQLSEIDFITAVQFDNFYRDIGDLQKIGTSHQIVSSYADDPYLLVQTLKQKYTNKSSDNLEFIREWADARQAYLDKQKRITRFLTELFRKYFIPESAAELVATHVDDPSVLIDYLLMRHREININDLSPVVAWVGSTEMIDREMQEHIYNAKVLPPPGAAPRSEHNKSLISPTFLGSEKRQTNRDFIAMRKPSSPDQESEAARQRLLISSLREELGRQRDACENMDSDRRTAIKELSRKNSSYEKDQQTIVSLKAEVANLHRTISAKDREIISLQSDADVNILQRKLKAAHDAINASLESELPPPLMCSKFG